MGYKINLNQEKNKLYNKEVIKEETKKRKKKEKIARLKMQFSAEKKN